jgi:hypothetical protein
MPSEWHDTVNELIEERPELAVEILRDLMGEPLPLGIPARTTSQVFNTRPSQDLVADKVVLVGTSKEVTHAIVVEAQKDPRESKIRQLPRYAMALWLQHECPVDVLVICPDQETAEYYSRPIPIPVPGCAFRPKPLFPALVPPFRTAAEVVAHPALATLSVAYHGTDREVSEAFVEGLGALGQERAVKYYEYGYNMSPQAVCKILEAIVATTHWPVYSPMAKEHFAQGKAEGEAQGRAEAAVEGARNTVLMVLKARGLALGEAERAKVEDCADLDQLTRWADAAIIATSTQEVFE